MGARAYYYFHPKRPAFTAHALSRPSHHLHPSPQPPTDLHGQHAPTRRARQPFKGTDPIQTESNLSHPHARHATTIRTRGTRQDLQNDRSHPNRAEPLILTRGTRSQSGHDKIFRITDPIQTESTPFISLFILFLAGAPLIQPQLPKPRPNQLPTGSPTTVPPQWIQDTR